MGNSRQQHITDVVFILALFGVFAVTALLVVVLGADVYQGISEGMRANDSARSSVAYISQKVHQQDAAGAVALGRVGEADALILSQQVEGRAYATWIYAHQGGLYELTVPADEEPVPGQGQNVLALTALDLWLQDGCIQIQVVDEAGNRLACAVAPRCGPVEVRG